MKTALKSAHRSRPADRVLKTQWAVERVRLNSQIDCAGKAARKPRLELKPRKGQAAAGTPSERQRIPKP